MGASGGVLFSILQRDILIVNCQKEKEIAL